MPKHYTSNSTDTPRLFRSNFLEAFTKVHFTIPLYIFLPIIALCIYHDFAALHNSVGNFALCLFSGIAVWSLTEYIMHRYVFHFTPHNHWQDEIHFIFHGVHHDFPKDSLRLVMPPSVSIPLAALFYLLFKSIFPALQMYAFFPGFLLGYLYYDMMHYAMHHYTFKTPYLKKVQQHHMLHHYQDEYKDFGVTSDFWDRIFKSESIMQNKLTKEKSNKTAA